MSEPPSNWNEIMGDKVFWDMVLAFKKSDKVWLKTEIDDEDDGSRHALALDFVKSKGVLAFSLFFMDCHGRPASATVQEVAGKFYVTDWADPVILSGPYATIEEGARFIISCGDGDTFTGASSGRLPAERMLALCEEAAGTNDEFEVNGVMHVMTAAGLEPKVYARR